jgi:ubiquinone/menaquinone biosynthesis C-methylase UbiE
MSTESDADEYKQQTRAQWNRTPCGTGEFLANEEKDSLAYFDAIRRSRYEVTDRWMLREMPFASAKGKRLLEIGHGIGSDLLTFAEAGAEVCGVDITEEHHRLAKRNFEVHGREVDLRLGDAASLDFPDASFDVVYSFGVLHHTPDTVRCISEAYRVLRPGGVLILGMYRRYSAFHLVAKVLVDGVLRGKLWRIGYDGVMATVEQGADGETIKPLVKTYSARQLRCMLSDFSNVKFAVTHFDRGHLSLFGRLFPRFLERPLEKFLGWYIIATAEK